MLITFTVVFSGNWDGKNYKYIYFKMDVYVLEVYRSEKQWESV